MAPVFCQIFYGKEDLSKKILRLSSQVATFPIFLHLLNKKSLKIKPD